MNIPIELTGTLVLVHPELRNDAAGKQNQIGMITGADRENDDVYVSFGNGEKARYSTDALLVLKPANHINRDLIFNGKELEKVDFNALFLIGLLQEYGTSGQTKTAIELAMQNETIRSHGMVTLEDALNIDQSHEPER